MPLPLLLEEYSSKMLLGYLKGGSLVFIRLKEETTPVLFLLVNKYQIWPEICFHWHLVVNCGSRCRADTFLYLLGVSDIDQKESNCIKPNLLR